MKHANKSQLMARAWAMHRETRKSMSACMTRAWELVRLTEALSGRLAVNIVYRKKDGSIRKALATLNIGPGVSFGTRRTPSPKVFTYWDIECCDFRCFKCENLISWYV